MNIKYASTDNTTYFHQEAVPYISFPKLSMPWLRSGFSTRLGGVSTGIYASMSLTFTRGDDPSAVAENFRRMGNALHIPVENMVLSDQTHTTNVLRITAQHKGMGILRERDFHDVDGLMTNEPGLCLVTSYADCVPLFFVDPVHRAIAASHSGWRGTVHNIAQVTVAAMQEEFGTKPEDLIVMVGPSICQHCYEVGEDVAEEFASAYGEQVFERILAPALRFAEATDTGSADTFAELVPGKYKLNLWEANRSNLLRAGILPENLHITDLCTCCNPELLHSHRASKGQRGGMCGFLMIAE